MEHSPLIFAHRGASFHYPENTMLAFRQAAGMGAHALELDVQLSRDQEVVVIHDETVNRTSDQQGYVKDYTYQQLLAMDFSAGFFEYEGIRIPTLDEVLSFAKEARLQVNIELKNHNILYEGLEERVLGIIDDHQMDDHVVLSSFNHISLVKVKDLKAGIETALIYSCMLFEPWVYARSCLADGLHPLYRSIQADTIAACRENGIRVRPWTVDDANLIKAFKNWGVDGIITNSPDVAMEAIR